MKTFTKIIFLTTCICCLCAVSCKDEELPFIKCEPLKIILSATEELLVAENNNSAIELFNVLHEKSDKPENMIFSPFSLNMALAMVWNGANSETRQAIQQAMGIGDYPQQEVNDYFKKLNEALLKTDPNTKLAIANAIWTRKGFPVKQSFYDVNKNYYNATARELNFASPDAVKTINKWCSDNTNGLIDKMIEEIPGDAVMYLMNALYFKGIWSNKFDASNTQKKPFYKEDGTSISAYLMFQNTEMKYFEDDNLSLASLDYGNRAFSMLFVLPNQNVSFDAMLNLLQQPDYFTNCIHSTRTCEVDLYIPKFKIEAEYEQTLKNTLAQLGMEIAFTESADFSGISNIAIYISKIKQKAYIEVNEKGTEAAAVTSIEMIYTSVQSPKKSTFRADHPFLFAIRENSTGAILFMGKVGNPK
jgi:serpin B